MGGGRCVFVPAVFVFQVIALNVILARKAGVMSPWVWGFFWFVFCFAS